MLNTKKVVEEVKAILEGMNFFDKVSTSKVTPLTAESSFPSVYISYDNDINETNGKMRNDGGEYDRITNLTLEVHLDLADKDDLYYLDVRDMIEEAILKDNLLWQSVIDRDVVGSRWDNGNNLPLKQGEIALLLFTRACVN